MARIYRLVNPALPSGEQDLPIQMLQEYLGTSDVGFFTLSVDGEGNLWYHTEGDPNAMYMTEAGDVHYVVGGVDVLLGNVRDVNGGSANPLADIYIDAIIV